MTTIKRATIKAYNAANHKAAVQIAGSLAVWLADLPVATDIPPSAVVAGRECTVLLYTDDNPDDAVVLSVHGAVPSGVPAGSRLQDADNDTWIDVETTADEDKIRLTVAGDLRMLLQTISPHIQLAGDIGNADGQTRLVFDDSGVAVSFKAAGLAGPNALFGTQGDEGSIPYSTFFVNITDGGSSLWDDGLATAGAVHAMVDYFGTGGLTNLQAGFFSPSARSGAASPTNMSAVVGRMNSFNIGVAPANARVLWARTPTYPWTAVVKPAAAFGLDVENQGRASGTGAQIADVYGVRVQGQRAGTNVFGLDVGVMLGSATVPSVLYGVRVAAQTVGAQRRAFEEGGIGSASDVHGNRFRSNSQFGSLTGSFGGGDGVLGIANATTVPSTNPTGGGVLYAEAGALKWRGSGGTVRRWRQREVLSF